METHQEQSQSTQNSQSNNISDLLSLIIKAGDEALQEAKQELKIFPAKGVPFKGETFQEYQSFLRSQAPQKKDFPHASEEEWEEILAGYRHRVSRILNLK